MILPGGMPNSIAGIGTDVIRIERIARAFERQGDRFARRILGEQELVVFYNRLQRDHARGIRYLATRFAAKEAFSKAIGLGMHSPMSWPLMQTLNQPGGRPQVHLSEPLAQWCAQRFSAAHVSLTDESDTAIAFVIVERRPAPQETPWAYA